MKFSQIDFAIRSFALRHYGEYAAIKYEVFMKKKLFIVIPVLIFLPSLFTASNKIHRFPSSNSENKIVASSIYGEITQFQLNIFKLNLEK